MTALERSKEARSKKRRQKARMKYKKPTTDGMKFAGDIASDIGVEIMEQVYFALLQGELKNDSDSTPNTNTRTPPLPGRDNRERE